MLLYIFILIYSRCSARKVDLICSTYYFFGTFYIAVNYGNRPCVELLLVLGADPPSWARPLHATATKGRTEFKKLLFQQSSLFSFSLSFSSSAAATGTGIGTGIVRGAASAASQDCIDMTPLHDAAYKGQLETYALLLVHASANAFLRDHLDYLASDHLDQGQG